MVYVFVRKYLRIIMIIISLIYTPLSNYFRCSNQTIHKMKKFLSSILLLGSFYFSQAQIKQFRGKMPDYLTLGYAINFDVSGIDFGFVKSFGAIGIGANLGFLNGKNKFLNESGPYGGITSHQFIGLYYGLPLGLRNKLYLVPNVGIGNSQAMRTYSFDGINEYQDTYGTIDFQTGLDIILNKLVIGSNIRYWPSTSVSVKVGLKL